MLISYLIPVYNVKNYIRTCLDSVLAQRGADFEVVLLDDGSTDGSGAICDEYARKYPEIVRVIHKENEGLFMTRRRGFAEAKGDWFVCVDSDDYVSADHLQTIVDAIGKYDCDMVMFDYESVYPDAHAEPSGIDIREPRLFTGADKQELYARRLLKNKYNNMWSRALRRDIVDFETDYSVYGVRNMCEDAIQVYELYTRAQKIIFLPQPLYAYRRNIASISANVTMDYWHAIQVSYELGWKYAERWAVPEETARAYAARCVSFYCDFLSWLLMDSGIEKSAQRSVFDAVIAKNESFACAAGKYKKEFLATKYLKLRNPLIIGSILRKKSCDVARLIFRGERAVFSLLGKR